MSKAMMILGFSCSVGLGGLCQPIERWEFVNPLPQGNDIRDVMHDGSMYWVVGDYGLVKTSNDGFNWNELSGFNKYSFTEITYGDGIYVIVGWGGHIFISDNGSDWDHITISGVDFRTVCYGDGLFMAAGSDGKVYTSSTGYNWTLQNSTVSGLISEVAFDGQYFIGVTHYGGEVIISSDGISWSAQVVTSNLLFGVSIFDSKVYVHGSNGTILFSSNLINWQDVSSTSYHVNRIVNFNGDYLSLSYGCQLSANGATWTPFFNFPTTIYDGIVVNGQLMAVGNGGLIMKTSSGISWTQVSGATHEDLNAVCHSGERFVAVGEHDASMVSVDGISWSYHWMGRQVHFNDVTYFNGQFYAVGNDAVVASSIDGITWSLETVTPVNDLQSIDHNLDTMATVGENGAVYYTDENGDWVHAATFINKLFDIHHVSSRNSSDRFVAVGLNGTIVYSFNGEDWAFSDDSCSVTGALYSIGKSIQDIDKEL